MERSEVFTLQSYEIDQNWGWICGYLETVDDAPWEPEDVRDDLLNERAQLWSVHAGGHPLGVVITKLGKVGETPCGNIWIAAGSALADGLKLLSDHIEPWFKAKGCKFVEVGGRKGWGKVLPDYRETGRIFVKDLI
jgi:hypothetical protein